MNDAPVRLPNVGDNSARPSLCSKEKVEGNEQVEGSPPTFDFDFDQTMMDADGNFLGEYLFPNHVSTLPIGEAAATSASASTLCFVGVQAWDTNDDRTNLAASTPLAQPAQDAAA